MGRAYEKVMENRKKLAEVLLGNIQNGYLLGKDVPENFLTPENPVTNMTYRGVNRLNLIMAAVERGCSDPRWLTFEQLKKEGYYLKRGSKGVLCEYWDFGNSVSEGQETEEEAAEALKQGHVPRVGYYYVFNAGDIEGIAPFQENAKQAGDEGLHEFLKNKFQEAPAEYQIQDALAGLFAELEQGVYHREICQIENIGENLDGKKLFQCVRQAQMQSEKLLEDYQALLFEQAVEIEDIPVEEAAIVIESQHQEEQILTKIEDFGRKIGGARKDVWKLRGLGLDDLQEMNAAEREKYVMKNNIWPKPDYEEMMQNGTPKQVVWFIKKLHDKLRSKPDSSDKQEKFVAFVQELREEAMKLQTEADCMKFWHSFFEERGYVNRESRYGITATEKFAGCLDNKFYKAVRVTRFDFDYVYDREMQKAQFGVPAEEKLPPGVKLARCVVKGQETYRVYKGGKMYAVCSTREDAFQWAKENLSRTQVRKQNYVPPQLKEIRRKNMNEIVTRPITGEDYINTFGFYGGEFGNLMTTADRQQSLNMGYEAFHDLAVALGIDDKEVSFGGKLAMAFGARGQGNAAAHYEPLRNVINLTKMKGAGSLAHEWGHALDDLMAKELGFSTMLSQTGAQMPEYMQEVINTMKYVSGKAGGEKTEYYKNALGMDKIYCKSDKGYWASDCEMFARAFACYVKDKLKPGINDYLCGHADLTGPEGEERERINNSMERMLTALKEQELLADRVPEQMMRKSTVRRGR